MPSNSHQALQRLTKLLGQDAVLADPNELFAYECDGFPIAKARPAAVVFPKTTNQVKKTVNILRDAGLQIVPRGSGTGLTGGSVAFDHGVIIATTRMTDIQSIDLDNRVAVVQAGVRNQALCDAVTALEKRTNHPARLRFSPDPSSKTISTIGGNAATNAGGINTLKYGTTTSHILAIELVTPDGTIHTTGPGNTTALHDGIGPDLTALICGSEGTLGIITRLWCRLTPAPQHSRTAWAVFNSTQNASNTVSDIIASGIIPASMEMLDGEMIRVVEQAFAYGFPPDAQALLLIELDGLEQTLDDQLQQITHHCNTNHAQQVQQTADPARQAELWQVRKRAFGAIGRISRSYCTQDACIPRSKLAPALEHISQIGKRFDMRITNVFHAGDGNVHPILLFDEDDPAQVQKVLQASQAILEYCISIGGTITGEHGIGVEKLHLMEKMFTPQTLAAFQAVKKAFDPGHHINDGKLLPGQPLDIQLLKPTSINLPGGAGS